MKRPPASIDWTQEIESSAAASPDPKPPFEVGETWHECSCHGATGAERPGAAVSIFAALLCILKGCAVLLAFFFFLAMLAGCEFIYLPECDTQCQAAGGADAYGRPQ